MDKKKKFTAVFISQQRNLADRATPRPWEVEEFEYRGSPRTYKQILFMGDRRKCIASFSPGGPNIIKDQVFANADYITAAANNYMDALDVIEILCAELKRAEAENAELRELAQRYEDDLNRILQPGVRWIELLNEYKAAGEHGVEWYGENGQYLELARARLIEALRDVAKTMVTR